MQDGLVGNTSTPSCFTLPFEPCPRLLDNYLHPCMKQARQPLTEKDLKSLRVFCAVAQAGGFSAAEQKLNMSKASVSRHIREIEEKLDVQLCERGPGGFRLTSAGHVAKEASLNALQALDDIKPEIDAVRGVLSGDLTIGMVEQIITDPACLLPESLAELKRQAPNVTPEILVMTYSQLDQAIRERRIQIGIRGKHQEDNFDYNFLFTEKQRIYASADVDEDSAKHLPLVYRSHPYVDKILKEQHFKRGPDADGLESIAMFIATGYYIGLLPECYAERIHLHYPLHTVANSPEFDNNICAITEKYRPLPASARLLMEILQKLIGGSQHP